MIQHLKWQNEHLSHSKWICEVNIMNVWNRWVIVNVHVDAIVQANLINKKIYRAEGEIGLTMFHDFHDFKPRFASQNYVEKKLFKPPCIHLQGGKRFCSMWLSFVFCFFVFFNAKLMYKMFHRDRFLDWNSWYLSHQILQEARGDLTDFSQTPLLSFVGSCALICLVIMHQINHFNHIS